MFRELIKELSETIGDTEHKDNINIFNSDFSLCIYLPEIYNQDYKKISKIISLVKYSSDYSTHVLNTWLDNAEGYRSALHEKMEIEVTYVDRLLDNKLKKIINALDYELKNLVLEEEI